MLTICSTLFQTGKWPLRLVDTPLVGWRFPDVLKENCGSTSHDLYGKLYCYLRTQLFAFLKRPGETGVAFELYYQNAADLPDVLSESTFARIEVCILNAVAREIERLLTSFKTANICEGAYLGLESTQSRLGPLLQSSKTNPHATLPTLTMGTVDLMHRLRTGDGRTGEPEQQKHIVTMKKYKHMRDLAPSPWVFFAMVCFGIPFLFDEEEHFED